MKVRYESFGGIVSINNPPALAWVDKEFMKEIGCRDSSLWEKNQKFLSAPTEVHFSLTNKCPLRCQHCYTFGGEKIEHELTTLECKKALKVLAKMGVFHIAFGGGECFGRSDFFELADFCRKLEMVPNVTTSGFYMTREIAKKCRVFGRINVSLDGIGKKYQEIREVNGFAMADRAIKLLVESGNRVGINCILCRQNFDSFEEIVEYAQDSRLDNILFLRFKPSGRGKKFYSTMRLTDEQNRQVFPLIKKFQRKYKNILFEVDCSFMPMVFFHHPSLKKIEFYAIEGCLAGNILLGTTSDGKFNACSHCADNGGSLLDLPKKWNTSRHLNKFRNWVKSAKEPCKSCKYLKFCNGGCHLVAEYVTGNFLNPDPECPFVVEADS